MLSKKIRFAMIIDAHTEPYGEYEIEIGGASCKVVENSVKALNKAEDLDCVMATGDLLLDGEPGNLVQHMPGI